MLFMTTIFQFLTPLTTNTRRMFLYDNEHY